MILVHSRSVRCLGLGAPEGHRGIGIGRSGCMAPLIFDFLDVAFKIFYPLELESEEF